MFSVTQIKTYIYLLWLFGQQCERIDAAQRLYDVITCGPLADETSRRCPFELAMVTSYQTETRFKYEAVSKRTTESGPLI